MICDWRSKFWFMLVLLGGLVVVSEPATGQIVPDGTLGEERSRVRETPVTGRDGITRNSDLIEGGARRGGNLFHSFERFDVPAGRGAYFGSAPEVQNIFSRVTGGDRSEINGRLGVFGNANLYFMNPNGILFGPSSSLDLGGSFVGTTANAIGFGEVGFFSATNPELPSRLLEVNPSAFFFNQLNSAGITNTSLAPAGTAPSGIALFGLRVPDGESLLLVGGDITIDNGRLFASGGRIELGGLAEPGAVALETTQAGLVLTFPDDRTLSNLTLANDAVVAIPGSGGGALVVHADALTATDGGRLITIAEGAVNGGDIEVTANRLNLIGTGASGNGSGLLSQAWVGATGAAGNIVVDAGSIVARSGGGIASATFGGGDAGDVRVTADTIDLVGLSTNRRFVSSISSETAIGSTGDGGNVTVSSRVLQVREGATISSATRSSGQGGNLQVRATERTELAGSAIGAQGQIAGSGLFASTLGVGNAGNLQFEGGQLQIRDGAGISAGTASTGDAGDVRVIADTIELSGLDATGQAVSSIGSEAAIGSSGDGGDVTVSSRVLQVRDGATISVTTRSSGQGGNLQVRATERAELTGSAVTNRGQITASGLSASTFGEGDAGNLQFEGGQLRIREGAVISAATASTGDAGDVRVTADTIELIGLDATRRGTGGIGSEAALGSSGDGGDVTVSSRVLQVRDGATISVTTRSSGQGGNLQVRATERAELTGSAITAQGQVSVSGLFASTFGEGDAGNLQFEGGQLRIREGAVISAGTASAGDAGDVRVTADTIELSGLDATRRGTGGIGSEAALGSSGDGGDVTVSSRVLQVRDGATISVSTFGSGQGGNLQVRATERAELTGSAVTSREQISSSGLFATTFGTGGNAGNLQFEGGQLQIRDGAVISAATFGTGDAGDVRVIADTIELSGLDATGQAISSIGSEAAIGSSGDGGDVTVSSRVLRVQDGATISSTTRSSGQGGNLQVRATERAELTGSAVTNRGQITTSGLFASTFGAGNAGNLQFEGGQLRIREGSGISAGTASAGDAGNVRVTADTIELSGLNFTRRFAGGISSEAAIGSSGDGGDVTVSSRVLQVRDGATISVSTFGSGQGGNLQVRATERAELTGSAVTNRGQIAVSGLFATTFGTGGNAGNLQFEGGQLQIRDGAGISAATFGTGDAGNVRVTADTIELIGLDASRQFASGIFGETNVGSTGNGGRVTVSTDQLTIRNGAAISTSTRGPGAAGNLRVTVAESAQLLGASTLPNGQLATSGLFATTSSSGNAGRIFLESGRLLIRNGAGISTLTASSGVAGNIRVVVDDAITLTGLSRNNNALLSSRIDSSIAPGATGDAGNIRIQARSLSVSDGAQISAVVARETIDLQGNPIRGGRGDAGDIRLDISDTITLSRTSDTGGFSSGVLTLSERGARGRAGNIEIRTGTLRITDGAIVTASTFNPSRAGSITINANTLEATEGGQIVTNTRSRGNAGDMRLNIADTITLSGVDPIFQNRINRARRYANRERRSDRPNDVIVSQGAASGIFANTQRTTSTGDGGTIGLTTRNLEIRDRATISAQSAGEGVAGDIEINASENLALTNSDITTAAAQASGGNITIEGGNVRLREDSDIRTEVNQESGTGGDITLSPNSMVVSDDSDILAFAGDRGGEITFNSPATFFESGYEPDESDFDLEAQNELDRNGQVNVNASGDVSGTITVPDISFIENSLNELSGNIVNLDDLIANSCIARTEDGGTFLVTGSGGLPVRPGVAPLSPYPGGEVRTEPEVDDSSSWQPGDAIVEPQGVYQLPDGQLVMSRECSNN